MMRERISSKKKDSTQRGTSSRDETLRFDEASRIDAALKSEGKPLEPALRQFMEPRFGHDFGRVRVHTAPSAAESAQRVKALAYTVDDQIAFAPGEYQPETTKGRERIAHELTHVIQHQRQMTVQGAGFAIPETVGRNYEVSVPDDASEREANDIARVVMRHQSTARPLASIGKSLGSRAAKSSRGDFVLQRQAAQSTANSPPDADTQNEAPDIHDTARGTLDAEREADTDVCYMETVARLADVYRNYLSQQNTAKPAEQSGSVPENVQWMLEYAQKVAARAARVQRIELARKLFPNLSARKALKAANALYNVMATSKPLETSKVFRGTGVGGAIAMMGGGSVVYDAEIRSGKLKPGAPIQVWFGNWIDRNGTRAWLSGQAYYLAITRGDVPPAFARRGDPEETFNGHSIVFVDYIKNGDSFTGIRYRDQLDKTVQEHVFGASLLGKSSVYMVGTNISGDSGGVVTAEVFLQRTRFSAEAGLRSLETAAAKHDIDPSKLSQRLLAAIALTNDDAVKGVANAIGAQTEINHDLVRLVGLWQKIVNIKPIDGIFGNGSCQKLVGAKLADAMTIKRDSAVVAP